MSENHFWTRLSLTPDVVRASVEADTAHHIGSNGECDYTVHMWNSTVEDGSDTAEFLAYVNWSLGSDILFIKDWDGEPIAAWIIDTNSQDGWVYWGQALSPG